MRQFLGLSLLLNLLVALQVEGQSAEKLSSDEGRRFAQRHIIWEDPSVQITAAFIPQAVLEKVAIEDLPLERFAKESLALEALFRETGVGHQDKPYPPCGEPRHFSFTPLKEEEKRSLEAIALDWDPSVVVVRVNGQEVGWNTLEGGRTLNRGIIEEVVRSKEGMEKGREIRFFTPSADFLAAGIRWCSSLFPQAHRTEIGDYLLLIGWHESRIKGIFTVGRYFPIVGGMVGLQPYNDIRDNRERPLAELIGTIRQRESPR